MPPTTSSGCHLNKALCHVKLPMLLTYTTTGRLDQMQTKQAAAYQALRCSQRDWKQGDEATAGKRSHAGQLASRSRSQVRRELPRHLS